MEDNGPGMVTKGRGDTSSRATAITLDRLINLQRQRGRPATLKIIDKAYLQQGTGEIVRFTIPFEKEIEQ